MENTTSSVKTINGKKAKNLARYEFASTTNVLIKWWLYNEIDDRTRMYYIVDDVNGEICSIALLTKMVFDPRCIHTNPWRLDYIYTKPQYRRRGYGGRLASYIGKHEEVSAQCYSAGVFQMFLKAGYRLYNLKYYEEGVYIFLVRSDKREIYNRSIKVRCVDREKSNHINRFIDSDSRLLAGSSNTFDNHLFEVVDSLIR